MQKNMIGLMLFIVMSMWLSASLVAANGTERVAVYCGSVQSWLDEMNALCLRSDGNRIDHLIEESSGMEDLHIYNCSYLKGSQRVETIISEKDGVGVYEIIHMYKNFETGINSFGSLWQHESKLLGVSSDNSKWLLSTFTGEKIIDVSNGMLLIASKEDRDGIVIIRLKRIRSNAFKAAQAVGRPLSSDFCIAVLELVNRERAKCGVAPLRLSDDLMDGAAIRARELSVLYSHTRPDGKEFWTVLGRKENVYLGENASAGDSTPESVVAGWMNSPGHRANILNPHFAELGVGYYHFSNDPHGYTNYWIQIFRGR